MERNTRITDEGKCEEVTGGVFSIRRWSFYGHFDDVLDVRVKPGGGKKHSTGIYSISRARTVRFSDIPIDVDVEERRRDVQRRCDGEGGASRGPCIVSI